MFAQELNNMMAGFMEKILIILSVSELSRQIATSSLTERVKRKFLLNQPLNRGMLALSSLRTYRKLLRRHIYYLFPIVFLSIILFKIHNFVADLIDCSQCTAFWLGLITNVYIFELGWPYMIVYSPLYIIGIYVIEKFIDG